MDTTATLDDDRANCAEALSRGERPADDLMARCLCLIEVTPPYFALSGFRMNGASLEATFPRETPPGTELGGITAAETGRHLAVLGACAAALANPVKGRHYYLAHRAQYSRQPYTPGTASHEDRAPPGLHGRAQACMVDRRTAQAEVALVCAPGTTMARLDITYHVVSDKAFGKLYKPGPPQHPLASNRSPYRDLPPLQNVSVQSAGLTATLPVIEAHQCQGHFPRRPAMSMAVVMGTVIRAAGELLYALLGHPTGYGYLVTSVVLETSHLAFAGQPLILHARYIGYERSNLHGFHCEAVTSDGVRVGDAMLTLQSVRRRCAEAPALHH